MAGALGLSKGSCAVG